jgi:hypothetical protein
MGLSGLYGLYTVVRDSVWLSLTDAVAGLATRDVRADRAKLDICVAIVGLRLRIRVHVSEHTETKVFEINDIEIPDQLNPAHVDWAGSRPALLYPWRTRSGEGWQIRPVTLVEARVEDFTTELIKDISSIELPSRSGIPADFGSDTDRLQSARELAQAEWEPCHGTVEALSRLIDNEAETISLSQVLSIMAFGSLEDPPGRDEIEVVALKQQAARALCNAACMDDVTMRGSHLSANGKVEPIFVAAFSFPRSVGDVPNSLARDHKDRAPSYTRITQSASGRGGTINDPSRFWDGDWFNVQVDVAALVAWLQFSIDSERRKQLDRKLSLRLFEYPFWSVETALCWIAIRDASRLKENLLWPSRARRLDKNVESQPEMRLLRVLKDGRLKAQNDGQVLPNGYWANSIATVGDLSAATPSLRLARADVLRIFPKTTTPSYRDVRARRQARIVRIVQRMQATRQWIGCAEVANWFTRHLADQAHHASQRSEIFNRLEKTFALGGFLSGRKSQLCQLRADTSVIRLICTPVDRKVDAEGFRPASVSHFLEDCWIPSEMCGAWFKQQKLEGPPLFEITNLQARLGAETEPPLGNDIPSRPGRPPLIPPYAKEFECVLAKGSLSLRLQQEADKLEAWGRDTLPKHNRAKVGTLENYIRKRVKTWVGYVPWK